MYETTIRQLAIMVARATTLVLLYISHGAKSGVFGFSEKLMVNLADIEVRGKTLWIHFNFICNMEKQKKLHKMLRSKINELRELRPRLIDGAVLTYHDDTYPPCLYFCLNILSMKPSQNRSKLLLEENIRNIPEAIKVVIREAVQTFNDPFLERLEVLDYEVELMCNNASFAYGGASIDEIILFASKGTEIALAILDDDRTKNSKWTDDNEIAKHIKELINELETDRERWLCLHFVCNPLGITGCEQYLRRIWDKPTESNSKPFLEALYKWNEISQFKNSK